MKITRRDFLRMAAYSAAAVGATQFDMFKLNQALAGGRTGSPPVIWFEGLGDQDALYRLPIILTAHLPALKVCC